MPLEFPLQQNDAVVQPRIDVNLGTEKKTAAPAAVPAGRDTAVLHLPVVTISSPEDHAKFIDSMAKAIRKATKRDQFIDTGTDEKAIFTTLQDLSEGDRKELADVYRKRYGITLPDELKREMSGADLAKANSLLDRKDSDNGDAGNIHTMLVEANQYVMGRSKYNIAGVIRDKLTSLNSTQIETLDKEYRLQFGKGLQQALLGDVNFDKYTKEMIPVLMKGSDKMDTADHLKLAKIALDSADVRLFQQVATNFSDDARRQFIQNGGEQKVKSTFGGHWYNVLNLGLLGNVSNTDLRHANDYMKDGHLSAATKLRDNTTWIGDNEKAIEDALKNISEPERKSYQAAREAIRNNQKPSEADQKIYDALNGRIKAAGNKSEVAAWEAMVLYPGSKLSKELLDHRGVIYDDSINKIVGSIEHVSKEDWQRLKDNPAFRQDMESVLRPFLNDSDMKRVKDAFDKLQSCKTYDDIQVTGHRSIENSLLDSRGIFYNDKNQIVESLTKMSPDEQNRYRTDSEYRTRLDQMVARELGSGAAGDAGNAILKRVMNNENPAMDIIDKINMHSIKFNIDEGQVIRDVEQAFRQNPDMRRMINNPKDAKETEFSKNFLKALHNALDSSEFETYAKPLLDKGVLDLKVQGQLNDWFLHKDKKALVENIITTDPEQRELLLSTDKNNKQAMDLQEKVFGRLNKETAEYARTVLQQRAIAPEDRIRSFVLGVGSTKEEVLDMMSKLSSEQKNEVFTRYGTKYNGSLTADVMNKLKKQDRDFGELVARNHTLNADEQFNLVLDAHSKSRAGVGRYMVDTMWDGTGFQSDEARNMMTQAMRNASIAGTDLKPDESMKFAKHSLDTLGLYRESKGKLGEIATDAVITVAALAGAYFTAGASLSLLAKTAIAGSIGAAIKIGGKSVVSGSDYDWSTRQVAVDGGVGFVYGATAFLGSQQLARALNIGGATGLQASELAQASLVRMAQQGGNQMVVEGSEQVIQEGLTNIARNMLLKGSQTIPMDALSALAGQVSTQGNEQAVKVALQIGLAQSLKQNAVGTGTRLAIEYGIPTAAGGLSGGTAGTVRGAADWNPDLPVDENLGNVAKSAGLSAGVGAGSAFVFKLGTKAVAAGYDAFTNAGADQMVNNPDSFINDNADDIGVFKKKPVVLKAIQAKAPTTIETLEGPVQANQGDWIMTGVKGEQWPVRPEVFARSYDPVPGAADMFQKKQIQVMAVQIDKAMNILDAAGKVKYEGSPGDWMVIGLNGDKYFVKPDVFAATYGPVDQIAQRTSAAADAAIARAASTVVQEVATQAPAIARAEDFLKVRSGDLTQFRKAPVELKAVQATQPEIIETWEGPQQAQPGDWIMTGVKGERWPLKPEMFAKVYEPTDTPGVFRKKPIVVPAIQIETAMQIFEDGKLKFTGKPTDWLVVNIDGKPYFVDNEVFKQTFTAVGDANKGS